MMAATNQAEFDRFAENYQASLGPGVVISGEPPAYYARRRISWLAGQLKERNCRPRTVLDFGCGTGTATPFLFDVLGAESVVGVDTSAKSLDVARRNHGSGRVQFLLLEDFGPERRVDLVYCNGVFHHIPVAERDAAMGYMRRALRPDGYLGLWENNAWNPVTHLLMWLGPVDRNAIPLTPTRTRWLASSNGFEVLRTDYLFIFPKWLRWLRDWEKWLARWPFGLQYQVLCRNPARGSSPR
jgi:SAM-dependent methyltransferase